MSGDFASEVRLDAADVDGARAFHVILSVEFDGVADVEGVKGDIDQRIGVEEYVLLLTFYGDEAEILFADLRLDFTDHSVWFHVK